MKRHLPFLYAVTLALSAAFAGAAVPRIVFDTDMCGDYDDVGALAVLNALADAGECEILAVLSSSRSSPALGMCEMINESYRGIVDRLSGEREIPMGVCKGIGYVAPEDRGVNEVFRSMVAARRELLRYPNSDDAPDANEVYRRVLADSPDGSVTLCTVGFLTNIRRLLETKGDDISPLTGRELVAKKVKAWYAMGGALPQGRECNLMLDPESSAIAIRDCPVPICFVDFNLGRDVLTGIPVARQGTAAGPVAEAFVRCMKAWNEERRGRPSWDELTVLAAVRGWERYFDAERGTMQMVDEKGRMPCDASADGPQYRANKWTPSEDGPHFVLVEKTPKARLREIVDELIARPPACRRKDRLNTRPFVWWHWCGTAVTKEGIVRDLDAMRDAGIDGATIFQVARGPCSEVPAFGYEDDTMADFEFGGDKWWDYVAFAASEAKKRGLGIGMHNCPGYTVSGGPWITPELAMKKLVWTSAPKGSEPAQPETNLGFYRDIGTVEKDGRTYRFGYTCTGSQCMPVAKSLLGRCLEADKMSSKAVNIHLDHLLQRKVGLDFILMDSYEAGPYDWTDDFRAEFDKRRGYDPLPLLPAYIGATQEGAEKIKADMARTVGELSTERHYWIFRDRIHGMGMAFVVEPYGGPFDKCEAAWSSDIPMTEFWGVRPFWVAPGAIGGSPLLGGSVGRAAGKTILAAEAFTAMPFDDPYVLSPRDFKACADASFARGINCMFLHHWVHQPFPACRKPGMNMGYWGAHFGENATWFEPGKEFFSYLARCQGMLQKGEEVIDVLAVEDFRGITDGVDVVPRRVFLKGVEFVPKCGSAVVRNWGSSRWYQYLAVPARLLADPAVAAKVEQARKAGVKILAEDAELPKRPFSVVDGIKVDANGPVLGTSRWDMAPDGRVMEVFFVANVSTNGVSFAADFRAKGQAELWYPGTGETEFLKPVDPVDGYVRLPMKLGPQESVFVTFRDGAAWPESRRHESARSRPVEGTWSVSFEPGRGAPASALTMEKLYSWSDSAIPGVRYFSGTATYRVRFALTKDEAKTVRKISLGDVRDIARVRLNGRDLGVAWYEPFEVATCNAAKEGDNELEVEVTNGWHNRLLGDHLAEGDDCEWGPARKHQSDMEGTRTFCGRGLKRIPDWAWNADGSRPSTNRVAFTSWDYFTGDESPRPSGLLGPVCLKLAK